MRDRLRHPVAQDPGGGRSTSAAPPIASAATPIAESARPPRSASAGAGHPRQQVVEAEQLAALPRAARSARAAVAATKERFQPMPRPNSATAVAGTLSTHRRLSADTAITSSPPASDGVRPMRSISVADHEHERVHPEHVRPDDREHAVARVVVMVDDDRAGQGHDPHHHGEARLAGHQRREHARAADDLAQRRRGASAAAPPARCAGSRRSASDRAARPSTSASATAMKATDASHSSASESPSSSRSASSGLNTSGPEDRAEHRAEEHERDAVRPPLGRVHVAGRGAREQRRPARRARRTSSPPSTTGADSSAVPSAGERAAGPPVANPAASTGTRPKRSIARPGRQRGERARGEHDRGAEPEQLVDAEDEHERQRRDGRRQLQHRRVGGQRRRQQQRVAADRQLVHRAHSARRPAVTAAATTTQATRIDPVRQATRPPARTPAVSAPTTSREPSANACVKTSAASRAGASNTITLVTQSGNSRPPSAIGPDRLEHRGHERAAANQERGAHLAAPSDSWMRDRGLGGARKAGERGDARRQHRHPGRRDRDERDRDGGAGQRHARGAARAHLGQQQPQEEGRVDGVEPERVGIAEEVTAERPRDRADLPGHVLSGGRAEQEPAIEAPVAAGGERPQGVEDGLALRRPR